ncbi:transmembrane protein, putative [Rhizoctonia solani AG-3 Rhs1AP]|uniref:Transmembrane protein, putative n=1 Tax=Rhizoctonia solani AG-3 Rhs1AP TaxID=1086054 RepID=X8JL02_9AGAM|nr:transmembrane protein, putative [Rhizoctonia solani AG-3 Rhs1AP]
MVPLPFLEYTLSHPHPKGHWFLLATVIVFLATTPLLILVNFATLGFELVPSLQTEWRSHTVPLETLWGTRRLPPLLRPRTIPRCEPKELGRGDSFRVTGSLFDYTVMSTWNQSHRSLAAGVQEQERVAYKGESFADCFVSTARYDYSLSEQTHSVIAGVRCPGYKEYPIEITMQTTVTFSWELTKDFIGQYYGGGLDLLNLTETSDYRKTVLAVLDVIASDALGILQKRNLSVPPLSIRVFFRNLDPDTAILPDRATTSRMTYVNGTQPDSYPAEGFIYTNTIYNLVYVVMDAINLDLGNTRSPNMFRNISRFPQVVFNNQAPSGINSETNWSKGLIQSFYYGHIPDQYQTWAETLRKDPPANITLANLSGPNKSTMATTYLCPTYELKPTNALLTSVFVGSSTMILSVWGAWMFFTAFLARKIMAPQVICYCDDCKARRLKEAMRTEAFRRRTANQNNTGFFTRLMARMGVEGRPKNIIYPADLDPEDQGYDTIPHSGRPMLEHMPDSKKVSDLGGSATGEK